MPLHLRVSAFTLVEMLAVTACIGILAVLLIPSISALQSQADTSACLSRFRQTGIAISSYIADNGGYLPGPNFSDNRAVPWYAKGAQVEMGTLAGRLYPYASGPEPLVNGKRIFLEVFQCPAVSKRPDLSKATSQGNGEVITRLLNINVLLDGNANPGKNPWGKWADPNQPVLPYARLAGGINLSKTWAMRECALGYATGNPGTAPGWVLNKSLPHKRLFNVLYFDWHVGTVDVETFKD